MLKGFYVDRDNNVHLIYEKEENKRDKFAKELVEENNKRIQAYNDGFAKGLGKDTFNMSDWFRFQEGLMPLIRESAKLVQQLHQKGYTNYKINMQSGIIE